MKKIILFSFILLNSTIAMTQGKMIAIDIGYFAPYLANVGGKIGTSFELKNWKPEKGTGKLKTHSLSINPQIGYFVNLNVQRNFLINTELVYKRKKSIDRMYPTASIGLGYILGIQNQDGTVDLATGNIKVNTKTINYFVPTMNFGFAKDPKKIIGYYFKVFYGRRISAEVEDDAFFGLELGLNINLSIEQH